MSTTVYVSVLPSKVKVTINVQNELTYANVSSATVTILQADRIPDVNYGDTYSDVVGTTDASGNVVLTVTPGTYDMVIDSTNFVQPTTATIKVFSGTTSEDVNGKYKITNLSYA